MGLVIGDYVHYRYGNYQKYGINRPGGGFSRAEQGDAMQMTGFSGAPANRTKLLELETKLNDCLNVYSKVKKNTDIIPSKDQEYVFSEMQKLTDEWLQKGVFFTPDGKAWTPNKVSGSHQKGGEKKYITERVLKNLITQVEYLITQMGSQIKNSQWAALLQTYNAILQTSGTIQELLKDAIINEKGNIVYSNPTNVEVQSLVKALNNIQDYLKGYGQVPRAQGDFAEVFTSAVAQSMEGVVSQVNSEFNKKITESFSSISQLSVLNGGHLSNGMNILETSGYHKKSGSIGANTLFQTKGSTKGKTDVEILYKDNDRLRLSIKNVTLNKNFGGNIHILSGSSVLQLLQHDANFLNHYLNIVPERKGTERNDVSVSPSTRIKFHLMAKSAIIMRALTGATYRLDSNKNFIEGANAFVVFNSGKVKCYAMSDIVDKLKQNYSASAQMVTGDFDDINAISNVWQSGVRSPTLANDRILKMLQQLHQMKLDVYIDLQKLGIK